MRQAVLDTDTLSYVIEGRYVEVTARARQYDRVFRYFTVSSITICEVVKGIEASGKSTQAFLDSAQGFEVLGVGFEEAVMAGQIFASLSRSGTQIGSMDPFIAAVAICARRPLITNNTKHYQRIVDLGFALELDNWRDSE